MKSQTVLETPSDLPMNLAMLAHDIKSPLNQVNGLLELALLQAKDDDMQNILRMAVKANQNLSNQVHTLLEGGLKVQEDHINQSVKVNFHDLITCSLDAIKGIPGFKKTTFITNLQVASGWVVSKSLLQSVIQNLLENSVKYRRMNVDRNIIIFSTHVTEDNMVIKVSDNGRGIIAGNLKSVFDKSNRNNEQAIDGHGMGLYLAKNAVHKLNGQINVESKPTEGTTFTITLPKNA